MLIRKMGVCLNLARLVGFRHGRIFDFNFGWGVMKKRFFVALRMTKRLDSCPFGFAQGRPFAGMTDQ